MIKLHDGIYNQNLIHYIKLNKFNVQSTEMSTKFQKLQKTTSIMERVMTILIFEDACFMRKIAYNIGHQISYN